MLFLDNLSPDSSVCGIIFGGKGRNQRLGNRAQRPAAAVRDKDASHATPPSTAPGCHHPRDWYDGGPTDIDNLWRPWAGVTIGNLGNTTGNW